MTFPLLISKYQKKVAVERLKSAYSQLSQAIQLSETKNGSKEYWDYTLNGENFYRQYFAKFLKSFDITNQKIINYKCLKGECYSGSYQLDTTPKIALANNITLAIANHSYSGTILIYVDINGFQNPNVRGKDLFLFQINKKYGLVPYGFGTPDENLSDSGKESFFGVMDREILLSDKNDACNRASSGNWCSALIMTDGWEIKKDYPW